MRDDEVKEFFDKFFEHEQYRSQFASLCINCSKSIILNVDDLSSNEGFVIAGELNKNFSRTINVIKEVALAKLSQTDPNYASCLEEIDIRLTGIEDITSLRKLKSELIDKPIVVRGIVNRVSPIRPMYVEAVFRCRNCTNESPSIIQEHPFNLTQPDGCPCKKPAWDLVPEQSKFVDSQEIRIQECPEDIPSGQTPRHTDIIIFSSDLINLTKCGDIINVIGVMKVTEVFRNHRTSRFTKPYLVANNIALKNKETELVEISKEDEAKILELAKDPNLMQRYIFSIAPSIYGHETEKEGCVYLLFGGVSKHHSDITIRGEINVLLVGDPSTAKSQLLKAVANAALHGIYASGKGSSAAGLTAAVVKDDTGEFTLEGGVLVLADKGIACLDEIDKMRPEDRSSIHEAMEQQCYDDQTETLTENGWKLFKDISKEEKVATLENGILEYVVPSIYINSDYNGKVIMVKSRQVDLLVTPNHNMYVNINKRADEWYGYGLTKAVNLPLKRMRFKKNAVWNGTEREIFEIPTIVKYHNQNDNVGVESHSIIVKMNDWLKFFGFYLSEGSVGFTNGVPYRVIITQSSVNLNIKKEIIQCVKRIGFVPHVYGDNVTINDKQLATYLSKFGKAHEKYIPKEIKELCRRQLQILYLSLIKGDGYHTKSNDHEGYVTSSNQLADDFQELCLKLGVSANKYLRVNKGEKMRCPNGHSGIVSHNIYELSVIRGKQCEPSINTNGKYHISTTHYVGQIFCVEVPSHLLYVRRNGIPVWCGNTVSIAKAGIVATLNARTAILAAGNPTLGRYDPSKTVAANISNLPSALFSRFDLIFIVLDKPQEEADTRMAEHILEIYREEIEPIPLDLIKKHIAYSKRLTPKMTSEPRNALKEYYVSIRRKSGNAITITARQLEALIRITEAHAKIFLRKEIEKADVNAAIVIFEKFLEKVAIEPTTGERDIGAIEGKTATYRDKADLVLRLMPIDHDTLIRELGKQKISPFDAEKIIESLQCEGAIMQPRRGYYERVI